MRRLFLVALLATAFPAYAGAVVGATEPTQILNNLELVSSTAQQAKMIQNQLQNLQTYSSGQWGNAQTVLSNLAGVVSRGQAISYALANADQAFAQRFPGYAKQAGTYSSNYQQWSQSSLDSVRNALSAAGLHAQGFADEETALRSIRSMSDGSTGSLQAIQAGSMIAAQQVEQLQKLRQLQMTDMTMRANFMASQIQQQNNFVKNSDTYYKAYQATGGGYTSRGGVISH